MHARNVPGASLAVVKDRRLVYARGYGWADREKQLPATPETLFRIASVSKPLTAVAVMQLVERGKLHLDDRAFDIVRLDPLPGQNGKVDPRLKTITVRQLLQHTGGWDRDKSFDPMFRAREIARAAGMPSPADPRAVIRYMLGQPLDFDPGTRYAYSNFGYCVLGRVIEAVTKTPYEKHLRQRVLAPMGINRMRIGASLPAGQVPGETRYYTPDNDTGDSVFDSVPGKVPWPYGGFNLEAMDAHGAWIASAVDLTRFVVALDDPRHKVLKPDTATLMYAPPPAPVSRKPGGELNDHYYGCGWLVRPVANTGKANYWHNGSLPGTATWMVRRWDGLAWAMLFNQRSEDSKLPDSAIDGALHRAAGQVREWPLHDLFKRYA